MNFHDSVNVKVCERVISMEAVLRRDPCTAANQNESVEREEESGSLVLLITPAHSAMV